MIKGGLFIQNRKGEKAFVGTKVQLNLGANGQGFVNKSTGYLITDIRQNGVIELDKTIYLQANSIVDFKIKK